MGGFCSKSSSQGFAYHSTNGHGNDRKAAGSGYQPNEQISLTLPKVKDSMEKQPPDATQFQETLPFRNWDAAPAADVGTSPDDFYDGIPRMPRGLSQKSRPVRSTQAAVAKVRIFNLAICSSLFYLTFVFELCFCCLSCWVFVVFHKHVGLYLWVITRFINLLCVNDVAFL